VPAPRDPNDGRDDGAVGGLEEGVEDVMLPGARDAKGFFVKASPPLVVAARNVDPGCCVSCEDDVGVALLELLLRNEKVPVGANGLGAAALDSTLVAGAEGAGWLKIELGFGVLETAAGAEAWDCKGAANGFGAVAAVVGLVKENAGVAVGTSALFSVAAVLFAGAVRLSMEGAAGVGAGCEKGEKPLKPVEPSCGLLSSEGGSGGASLVWLTKRLSSSSVDSPSGSPFSSS